MSVLGDNNGASVRTVREEVAELLGVTPDDVDPDADLIASGLDSIRMMSLSGRWRKQGIDVNFAALAENPTVAAWSALVAATVRRRRFGGVRRPGRRRLATPAILSRWRPCSTRCGWAATTISNSVASPPIFTWSSTVQGLIRTACATRQRNWLRAIRCCAWRSCPTVPSGSAIAAFPSPSTTCASWMPKPLSSGWKPFVIRSHINYSTAMCSS